MPGCMHSVPSSFSMRLCLRGRAVCGGSASDGLRVWRLVPIPIPIHVSDCKTPSAAQWQPTCEVSMPKHEVDCAGHALVCGPWIACECGLASWACAVHATGHALQLMPKKGEDDALKRCLV